MPLSFPSYLHRTSQPDLCPKLLIRLPAFTLEEGSSLLHNLFTKSVQRVGLEVNVTDKFYLFRISCQKSHIARKILTAHLRFQPSWSSALNSRKHFHTRTNEGPMQKNKILNLKLLLLNCTVYQISLRVA